MKCPLCGTETKTTQKHTHLGIATRYNDCGHVIAVPVTDWQKQHARRIVKAHRFKQEAKNYAAN